MVQHTRSRGIYGARKLVAHNLFHPDGGQCMMVSMTVNNDNVLLYEDTTNDSGEVTMVGAKD